MDEGDPPLVELEVVPMVVDAPEPKLVEEPKSLPVEEEMAFDSVQEEPPAEDDGWGFDEDAETASAPPLPPVIAEPPEEDDGWGFDASPSSSPPKPAPTISKPSHGRKQSVDGWGFDPDSDDDASSKPLTPSAAPRQARRLEKAQAKSKGHSGSTLSAVRSGSTSSSVREDLVAEERSSPVVRGGMRLGKKHSSSNLSLGSSSRRQGSDNTPLDSPMFGTEEAEEVVLEEAIPERRGPTIVTERMVVSARSKLVVAIAEEVIRDVEAMKLLP